MLTIFHWKIVRAHLTPWDICAERMTILIKLFASLRALPCVAEMRGCGLTVALFLNPRRRALEGIPYP